VKKVIFVLVLLITIILITLSTKKEIVKLDLSDQIISTTALLDKNMEIEYEKAVDKPIVFTNKHEYERFAKQYFKFIGMDDFKYQKYDLLLVNGKKINPRGDTLYSFGSITKLRNSVEITLKIDGKVEIKEASKDSVIENILYLRLNKGTISPKSNFKITKE
jgi:hypothetical protein